MDKARPHCYFLQFSSSEFSFYLPFQSCPLEAFIGTKQSGPEAVFLVVCDPSINEL
jgi:hypothetical protein